MFFWMRRPGRLVILCTGRSSGFFSILLSVQPGSWTASMAQSIDDWRDCSWVEVSLSKKRVTNWPSTDEPWYSWKDGCGWKWRRRVGRDAGERKTVCLLIFSLGCSINCDSLDNFCFEHHNCSSDDLPSHWKPRILSLLGICRHSPFEKVIFI